ncbi:MAG: prolyl oligopeptidase family serine peptidase [Saprospiraceae bacterium]|nr:prolyl oligopeptidase family serine peptidase [Saprospiraceae bacterium]
MHKIFLSGIILCIALHNTFTQIAVNNTQLSIDRLYNSAEFIGERFGPHQWLAGGEYYTTLESSATGATELVLYDSRTGERKILIASHELIDPVNGQMIRIEDYTWSSDEKLLLIFTNSEKVWRTNTRGDYFLFNLDSRRVDKLGKTLQASSLMFAKFNSTSSHVAYVSEQNIYVENVENGEILQITSDGTTDIINGTFDWAYEEEFFCKDGFRWSPDGKSIAYWQIDATKIRDFYVINNTASVYPQIIPIQYPKVGENPSSARIGVVNIQDLTNYWIPIPGDPFQHYIPRVQWLGQQNKLLITQLARKQNHLILWTFNRDNQVLQKIYEEESESWIDVVNIDISSSWEMHDQPVLEMGNAFVWMSERDGWRHLYKINSNTGEEFLLTPGDYDIASIKGYDAKMNILYVIASPENPTHRYLYALRLDGSDNLRKLTPNQNAGINNYDISPSGKYAIYRRQFSNTPEIAAVVTLPGHEVTQMLYENEQLKKNMGQLDLPSVEFFKVTTEDNVTLDGKLIKPLNFDSKNKYPVLFYVYGEPGSQTAVANLDNFWHLMLAQKGYLIITMDNRGTPTLKGAQWRKSIYRKLGIVNSRDQAMAAKEILKWDFIDDQRVGVWGWSGGGAMTLNLMFRYPEIYKTGIAIAAVTNQLFYDNIYQERYMGLPSEGIEHYIDGSPAAHAGGLQGDLLYIHGTGDDNVHYQNAEFLINALISENKQFDLMIYPNRKHSIYEGRNTTRHLYQKMTDFLHEHLMTLNQTD